jgi:hypothetical protein
MLHLKCCTYTGSKRTIVVYRRTSASVGCGEERRYGVLEEERWDSRVSRELKRVVTEEMYASSDLLYN